MPPEQTSGDWEDRSDSFLREGFRSLVKEEFVKPARILAQQKRIAEAIKMLFAGLDQFPDEIQLLYAIGDLAMSVKDEARAGKYFERVIKQGSEHKEDGVLINAYARLMKIAAEKHNFKKAKMLAREALNIIPGNNVIDYELGKILIQEGDLAGARCIFEAQLARRQTYSVMVALARIARIERKLDEARALLGRAIEKKPKCVIAFTALARVEMAAKQYGKAIEILEAALRLDPNDDCTKRTLREAKNKALRFCGGKI